MYPWENKWSQGAHSELRWPWWSRRWGPMITAQSRLGEVTAQSRRGHSSVTARSRLNHGPVHGSVTAGCYHFGHRELTVSSPWAHREQSWWPIFSHGYIRCAFLCAFLCDPVLVLVKPFPIGYPIKYLILNLLSHHCGSVTKRFCRKFIQRMVDNTRGW